MNDVMKVIRKIVPISSLASHHNSPNNGKKGGLNDRLSKENCN